MNQAKAQLLGLIRRGPATVLWPKPDFRVGNLLYIWLQAMRRVKEGKDCRVLITAEAEYWEVEFPQLFHDLCVPRKAIKLSDRRELGTFQSFGTDYLLEDLDEFCRTYLLPSPGLTRFRGSIEVHQLQHPGTVVVNVRRGDYYSVPEYRQRYGFDVKGYLEAALKVHSETRQVERVLFVSDDVDWCWAAMGPTLRQHGIEMSSAEGSDAMRDLAHLALSNRLVLANSTFSYWGGYLAGARSGNADIVAPWFHARDWLNGKSFHLNPGWRLVEGFHERQHWLGDEPDATLE